MRSSGMGDSATGRSTDTYGEERDDPLSACGGVLQSLLSLVEVGLLQMGTSDIGETVFWATDKGIEVWG